VLLSVILLCVSTVAVTAALSWIFPPLGLLAFGLALGYYALTREGGNR